MKRLLKGGRVIDPANGIDGRTRRPDRRRSDRPCRPRPTRRRCNRRGDRGGARHLSGLHRHARPPEGARAGAQGDGRDRHRRGRRRRIHGRGLHAEHESRERQRERHGVHPRQGGGRQPGACISDWRRLTRIERGAARRDRGAETGRVCGHHRRRPSRRHRIADAPRDGVRGHVRHASDRALRGSVAEGRRGCARGVSRRSAGTARHARCVRGARSRTWRPDVGADGNGVSRRPHERRRLDAGGAKREGSGCVRHVRSGAASLHADRRVARVAYPVRHQHQDESAAAGGEPIAMPCSPASPTAPSMQSPPTTPRTTTTRSTWSSTARPLASSGSRPPCRCRSIASSTPA